MQIFNITKYKLQQTRRQNVQEAYTPSKKTQIKLSIKQNSTFAKENKMKKQLQQFFQLYLKTVIYNSICTSIRNLNVTRQLFFETTFLLKTKIKGS